MLEKKNKGKLICKSPNDIISGNFDSEKVRGVYSSIIPHPPGMGEKNQRVLGLGKKIKEEKKKWKGRGKKREKFP